MRDMWGRRRGGERAEKKNHRRSLERMCSKNVPERTRERRGGPFTAARAARFLAFLDGSDVVRPARPRAAERPERVDLTATFPGCLTTRKRGLNPAAGRFRSLHLRPRKGRFGGGRARGSRARGVRARGFFAVNARSRRVPQRPAGASREQFQDAKRLLRQLLRGAQKQRPRPFSRAPLFPVPSFRSGGEPDEDRE